MKEQLSRSYMDKMKSIHADKPLRLTRKSVVIGVSDGNIGMAISQKLPGEVSIATLDEYNVQRPPLIGTFSDYDIIVLAQGFTHLDWFEDATLYDIDETFDVNVVGALKAAQGFVRDTIGKPYKKYIVFIGSMAYRNVLNASSFYCASKAALAMASRCLAWELAPKGYNVFCVHPSNTEGTPMTEKTIQGIMRYRGLNREQAEAYWGACLPKAQWLQPEDIANTVAWLVSGQADYMSGSNVELAGGQR
jgi:NAD(P)-dependent dehydrogenase (short-subunit alcohol dehydrogenase family)